MKFNRFERDSVFGFNHQLIASKGIVESCDVRQILMERLPGCVDAYSTDTDVDRTGVDWIAKLSSGRECNVDVKMRERDCQAFGNDDVALETWSVVNKAVGWTRDESKACEWVLWVWKDTGRFLLVPFLPLCGVFSHKWQEWRIIYGARQQITKCDGRRWQSECVFVPRVVVLDSLVQWFGGSVA